MLPPDMTQISSNNFYISFKFLIIYWSWRHEVGPRNLPTHKKITPFRALICQLQFHLSFLSSKNVDWISFGNLFRERLEYQMLKMWYLLNQKILCKKSWQKTNMESHCLFHFIFCSRLENFEILRKDDVIDCFRKATQATC